MDGNENDIGHFIKLIKSCYSSQASECDGILFIVLIFKFRTIFHNGTEVPCYPQL